MKKVSVYLTHDQHQAIAQLARRTGVSKSELIRRAIDAYYATKQPKDLTAFLKAIEKTSGVLRDWTETGAEYVDRMRGSPRETFERIEGREPANLRRKAADLIREERSLRDHKIQDGWTV